ncbi:MAG: hypothetical protein QW568_00055 [Candidatus Anstonellaceae archaeon]
MELKVARTRDGIALSGSLPSELAEAASVELFYLRDGIYLLSKKGAVDDAAKGAKSEARRSEGAFSEGEKSLVRKLLTIRFERRTPAEVSKALSKDEKATLDSLMKKNAVQVFHGGKYAKEGVYNISDAAFNAVREPHAEALQASGTKAAGAAPASLQQAKNDPVPASLPISSPMHLERFGWMVLDTDADARNFANSYPDKIKSGMVRGVRAFDRRFYFVSKGFVEAWEKEVQLALGKGEKTDSEIASEIGLAEGGCRALLYHLCESGEVMEKKKGKFARA